MCLNPITIKNPNYRADKMVINGNYHVNNPFNRFLNTEITHIQVGCGYCPECAALKQTYISQRAGLVATDHFVFFQTLTLANRHLKYIKDSNGYTHKYFDISYFQKYIKYIRRYPSRFFGTDEWKLANNLNGIEREKFLVELYKREIKRITKAKYVFAYRLCYPNKNQTYYYLIHLTNHIDGITLMKDSFASVNNGRVEYLGKNNDLTTLFDLSPFKTDEMYNNILIKYRETSITFANLWESIVEETAYTSKDLNLVLQELEKQGKVKIKRITSKRCSYKEQDLITFS